MRYSQAEKMEIIRLVEESSLSVRKTLDELQINRSTFYAWYRNYLKDGYDGLADQKSGPKRFWNKIPDCEKEKIVDKAIELIKQSGLLYQVCPFETVIEGDYDEIMKLVKEVQKVCYDNGAEDMLCYLKIQSSGSKHVTIDDKMKKYKN